MTTTRPRDRAYYQALYRLGCRNGGRQPAASDLEALIEQYQAPYNEPEARAWIEKKLRSWARDRDGQ